MANAKQVMDMRTSKGMSVDESNEHQRRWTEKGWERALSEGNYDRSREHLNFEITKGGKVAPVDKTRPIPDRIRENLQARGITDPNLREKKPRFVTEVKFVLGGSRERMRELAFGNQEVDFAHGADNSHVTRKPEIEQWAQDMYAFMSDRYGEENIASFTVHLDELNPHVHCVVLPITGGVFNFSKLFAGKNRFEFSQRMKELHDAISKVNERWGMKRGTSTSITGAKHRSTEEYRRQLNEICSTIEEQIEQHKKVLGELVRDIKLAETRVKGLNSMIDNLKKSEEEKKKQLKEIAHRIAANDPDSKTLLEAKEQIEKDLKDVQTQLADKEDKLSTANKQLDELNKTKDEIAESTNKLRTEAKKYSSVIQSNEHLQLRATLADALINDFLDTMDGLTPEQQSLFNSSMVRTVADRGGEVLHVAALLMAGLINDATTFAEGHGGGGTTSDLKWGKDDDEDDEARRFRCLHMATRMMRPSTGKKVKR